MPSTNILMLQTVAFGLGELKDKMVFVGGAVVVSHDRWFLDRICTHILAFEGNSSVYFFEGSYSEYEENHRKRMGGEIVPTRLKYKKLVR